MTVSSLHSLHSLPAVSSSGYNRQINQQSPTSRHCQQSTPLSQSYPHSSSLAPGLHHPPHPYHSARHNSLDSQASNTSSRHRLVDSSSYPHTFSTSSASPGTTELIYTPRQIPHIPHAAPLNYPLPLSTDQHLAACAVMQERQESWTRAAQSSSSASTASSPGTGSPIQALGFGSLSGQGSGSGSGAYNPPSGSRGAGAGNGKSKAGGGGGGGGGNGKGTKPRKKVAKACLSCQKSHLTCDESEFMTLLITPAEVENRTVEEVKVGRKEKARLKFDFEQGGRSAGAARRRRANFRTAMYPLYQKGDRR